MPTLLDALAEVRDPRGPIHPLPAVPALAVVAVLAGAKSLEAIAQFGRDRTPLAFALGFRRARTPNESALGKLFRRIDPARLEAALGRWLAGRATGAEAIALDGKALRGSATGNSSPPMSPPRSATRPPPPYGRSRTAAGRQVATTSVKGHGRRARRSLVSTASPKGYLNWPGAAQVFRPERSRTVGGATSAEVVYGVTSLPRERADAARLLELVRGRWSVENELFGVRDNLLGEDACRVRTGAAPRAFAGLRNVVVCILSGVRAASRAAATRRLAARPNEAIALLST